MVERKTDVERHPRKLESGKTIYVKQHKRKLDPLNNPYPQNNPVTKEQKDLIVPGMKEEKREIEEDEEEFDDIYGGYYDVETEQKVLDSITELEEGGLLDENQVDILDSHSDMIAVLINHIKEKDVE